MSPAWTHSAALAWPEPSLVVLTLAVLSTSPVPGQMPAVAAVVGLTMWTVKVVVAWVVLPGTVTPAAPPQVSEPAAMAQVPAQPAPWLWIDQLRPGVGRQDVG